MVTSVARRCRKVERITGIGVDSMLVVAWLYGSTASQNLDNRTGWLRCSSRCCGGRTAASDSIVAYKTCRAENQDFVGSDGEQRRVLRSGIWPYEYDATTVGGRFKRSLVVWIECDV